MDVMAERLREQREKRRFTQSQVEEYEGIKQPALSKWEAGAVPAALKTLARLVRRYQTSADYLLGLTDDPRPMDTTAHHKITDEQAAILELFEQLDEEERHYVKGLLTFVKSRNTPRIIGEE